MELAEFAQGFAADLVGEVCGALKKRKGAEAARDRAWAEASTEALVEMLAAGRIDQAAATLTVCQESAIEFGFKADEVHELGGLLLGNLLASSREVAPSHPLASACSEFIAAAVEQPEPEEVDETPDGDPEGADGDDGNPEGDDGGKPKRARGRKPAGGAS